MEFDLYKKIIDSCPSATEVHPQGFGEPLLYPKIIEAIEYARRKGKRVVMYTNASLLDRDMASKLLEAELSEIRFSVDEYEQKLYEALRVGLKWETVLGNIEYFQRLKKKKGYKTRTRVRICITRENHHRIKGMKKYWKERVDIVTSKRETDIPPPSELRNRMWSSLRKPIKCNRPYKHLSVKSNGDLVLCCNDWFNVYKMANLHESDVMEAYNSEKFNDIRERLRTGVNYPALCEACKARKPRRHGEKFNEVRNSIAIR